MRILIDAMGGDNAPGEIVAGALEGLKLLGADDELVLVGRQEVIESELSKLNASGDEVEIVDAPEVVEMDEKPVDALRKKRKSSIAVMAKMAARGEGDAVISAGNTGACVAAYQMRMRNLPGVNRPGIAVVFPTFCGPVTICDVGANISCKPINLYQYAIMASIYATDVVGIENPRVGLLSIGEEDAKGNEVVKKTCELLREDEKLNFIGNIEGRDIFQGGCDVAICEGFVGNVVLKLTEGLVDGMFKAIQQELMEEDVNLAMQFKPVIKNIYKKYDHHEYGGAPLLGINGNALICHGSSSRRTIKNAIEAVKKYHKQKINEKMTDYLAKSMLRTADEES